MNRRHWLKCLPALAAAPALAGCGTGPQRAAAVDESAARSALESTLNHWKQGDRPEAMKAANPSITVQDLDWERGCKLVAYSITEPGQPGDANLRVGVALTLTEPDGKPAEKVVRYIVGTDPSITVFREWF
jgi:hypothetical protein